MERFSKKVLVTVLAFGFVLGMVWPFGMTASAQTTAATRIDGIDFVYDYIGPFVNGTAFAARPDASATGVDDVGLLGTDGKFTPLKDGAGQSITCNLPVDTISEQAIGDTAKVLKKWDGETDTFQLIQENGQIVTLPFTVVQDFSHSYAAVEDNSKKWGIIDTSGTLVVACQFSGIPQPVTAAGYAVAQTDAGQLVIIHIQGQTSSLSAPLAYAAIQLKDNGYNLVNTLDTKVAFIDNSGNMLFSGTEFDDAREFSEGLAAVEKAGQWEYIDVSGAIANPVVSQYLSVTDFYDGAAVVFDGTSFSMIDKSGNPFVQDDIPLSGYPLMVQNDRYVYFVHNDAWGVMDATGNVLFQADQSVPFFFFNKGIAVTRDSGSLGVINVHGEEIISHSYDAITPMSGGTYFAVGKTIDGKLKYSAFTTLPVDDTGDTGNSGPSGGGETGGNEPSAGGSDSLGDSASGSNSPSASGNAAVVTDPASGIEIDCSGGASFGSVTPASVAVSTVASGDPLLVKLHAAAGGQYTPLVVSDIRLLDTGGNPITSFDGTVKVKIPIPAGTNRLGLTVLWYDPATGKLTDMHGAIEGDYIVFETNHFSYYALANVITGTTGDRADPAATRGLGGLAVLACLACAGLALGRRKTLKQQ